MRLSENWFGLAINIFLMLGIGLEARNIANHHSLRHQAQQAASGRASAVQLRTFSSIPSCNRCSIEASQLATLKPPPESLSFDVGSQILLAANGSFVAWGFAETRSPVIFDASGRFVRRMTREGRGPGEVEETNFVARADRDSLWIFDGGRKHVFSPDMRFVRTERGLSVYDLVVAGGGRLVLAQAISTPRRAGFPLHLVAPGGQVTLSFGVEDPTLDPKFLEANNDVAPLRVVRNLAPAGRETFWSYNPTRFLLERYSFSGARLGEFRHSLDGWYRDASAVKRGRGEFPGLPLTWVLPSRDSTIIWLVYNEPNAAYKPNWRVSQYPASPTFGIYNVVVEAFSLQTMSVVAMRRFPNASAKRVLHGPDLIAFFDESNGVFGAFRIMKLSVLQ